MILKEKFWQHDIYGLILYWYNGQHVSRLIENHIWIMNMYHTFLSSIFILHTLQEYLDETTKDPIEEDNLPKI
jgi:hypothetical protein